MSNTETDISKEAVERLAKTADLFAKAMKAFQHKTKKHNEDVRDTLRAQAARIEKLEAALKEAREGMSQRRTECRDTYSTRLDASWARTHDNLALMTKDTQ